MKTVVAKNKGSTPVTSRRARGGESPAGCSAKEQIATAAYYKAEARGFAPGNEIQDWLQAEAELASGSRSQTEVPPVDRLPSLG